MSERRFPEAADVVTDHLSYGTRHWFCRPEITGARHLLVGRLSLAPGAHHPFHRHPGREQFLLVVSGTAEQWIGEERRFLEARQTGFVPTGVVHATFNPGDVPLDLLEVTAPAEVSGPFAEDASAVEPWRSLTKRRGFRYLKVRDEGEVTVAEMLLKSIVESSNIARIDAELQRLASEGQRRRIVLDFGDVEFLSSTMLAVLLQMHGRVEQGGGTLRLCGIRENLQEVFRVTRLDRRLNLHPGLREALEAF